MHNALIRVQESSSLPLAKDVDNVVPKSSSVSPQIEFNKGFRNLKPNIASMQAKVWLFLSCFAPVNVGIPRLLVPLVTSEVAICRRSSAFMKPPLAMRSFMKPSSLLHPR